MLDTNVTLRDLGLLIVFFVIIVAGVFLIRALMHLSSVMRDLKKLIGKNAESLDKVIKDLPALSANAVTLTEYVSDVADNLRGEQELIDSVLENVSDTIESVSETARAINEDFLGSIKRLAGSIMTLVRFITKKKPPDGEAAGAGIGAGGNSTGGRAEPTEKEIVADVAKPEKRERKAKKPRIKSAAVAARKRQVDKARNINIHIR